MRWVIMISVGLLIIGVGGWSFIVKQKALQNSGQYQRGDNGSDFRATGKNSKRNSEATTRPSSGYSPLKSGNGLGGFSPDNEYEDGELLVSNPPRGFAEAISGMGFYVTENTRLETLGFSVLRLAIPSGMSVPQARKTLRAKFPGLSIDANHIFEAQGVADYLQNLPRALVNWRKGTPSCGGGIRLGMIDASVDINHPALKGQRIEYRSFHKTGRRPGPADHGTAVAAILVGKPKWGGLLPGAELVAANMFEVNEVGRVVGNGMALIKAINWMVEKQVQVVNMSIAGADNKIVHQALERAKAKGLVMVVAAAGNWGKKGNPPAYPAAYKGVIAVTAFDKGKKLYSNANVGSYIDFAAPGVDIYTAVPEGGRIQSGTSFAAPFVSVLVALKMERGALRGPDEMRKFLRKYSIDMGSKGKDNMFGWGTVNLQPKCL